MGESMRGSRLGTTSYEVDSGEYAPRALTTYVCDQGHRISMPFSVEADESPTTWPCACGAKGLRQGVQTQPTAEPKHVRTHWDMLLERRTIKDLECILKERLEVIRAKAS
jgi:hypothetical protein